jgi:antitoxin (DNA-binding transcriptional repressor) of toxin-antitoxin stability system
MFDPTTAIIGIKQLHVDLKSISQRVQNGEEFVVVKNSKPVFRIIPLEEKPVKKYTLKDFESIQFKGGKDLSKNIDKILYGA